MASTTRSAILQSLAGLGIRQGDTVMVHASLRQTGPVIGGAATIINALLESIGPSGTLVAYVDFEAFFEDGDPEIPIFNKLTATVARDHGVLHEMIRTWPGSLRSDHPGAGISAIGAKAAWLTENHPFQYGYGPGTPFENLFEINTKILMLGAPLDTITLLHYAEHLADISEKQVVQYRHLMPTETGPQWIDFEEFDTSEPVNSKLPENVFEQIAEAFLESGQGTKTSFGQTSAFLFESKELIPFAKRWLEDYFPTNAATSHKVRYEWDNDSKRDR